MAELACMGGRQLKPGGRLAVLELGEPSFPPARWFVKYCVSLCRLGLNSKNSILSALRSCYTPSPSPKLSLSPHLSETCRLGAA